MESFSKEPVHIFMKIYVEPEKVIEFDFPRSLFLNNIEFQNRMEMRFTFLSTFWKHSWFESFLELKIDLLAKQLFDSQFPVPTLSCLSCGSPRGSLNSVKALSPIQIHFTTYNLLMLLICIETNIFLYSSRGYVHVKILQYWLCCSLCIT